MATEHEINETDRTKRTKLKQVATEYAIPLAYRMCYRTKRTKRTKLKQVATEYEIPLAVARRRLLARHDAPGEVCA